MKKINYKSIQLDNVCTWDYPDFCDAYICYAEYEDGTELTEAELDKFNEENGDIINELAQESLY